MTSIWSLLTAAPAATARRSTGAVRRAVDEAGAVLLTLSERASRRAGEAEVADRLEGGLLCSPDPAPPRTTGGAGALDDIPGAAA